MSHAPGMRHPPWLSHASDVILSSAYDVTITALRISVDLRDLLAHWNCFVNEIRVTLWSRAGYILRRPIRDIFRKSLSCAYGKSEKQQFGPFLLFFVLPHSNSRLYNQIRKHSRCRTKQMFHLEPCNDRDFAFDERSRRIRFVEQCVAIFHLMRNPWPSHGSAWNICLLLQIYEMIYWYWSKSTHENSEKVTLKQWLCVTLKMMHDMT